MSNVAFMLFPFVATILKANVLLFTAFQRHANLATENVLMGGIFQATDDTERTFNSTKLAFCTSYGNPISNACCHAPAASTT